MPDLGGRTVTVGATRTTVLFGRELFTPRAVSALEAARPDLVVVLGHRAPTRRWLPQLAAIDEVAPTLGVHPALLHVKQLHDTRLVAWETAEPKIIRGPASAHVERPALEHALAALVSRVPAIEPATTASFGLTGAARVIDATGRRAFSAQRRIGPPEPWIARTFCASGRFTAAEQAFRMAALPDGYAYRLGTDTRIVLGVAGIVSALRRTAEETERHLADSRGGWLLAGLPRLSAMLAGRGGVASVQWTEGNRAMLRVGDAALARDALASQGLANGVSDAMHVAAGESGESSERRRREQREKHVSALLAIIARCRYRHSPSWSCHSTMSATTRIRIISPRA